VTGRSFIDWQELREFAGTDLRKSFVLSWSFENRMLMVDVDLYLEPEHPFYEKPRPAEKVCIRPAIIEFPHCESVAAGKADPDASPAAVTSTLDIGAIEGLRRFDDGPYEIFGDFGKVRIDAERPVLRLQSP
jgi:hypothetical protein